MGPGLILCVNFGATSVAMHSSNNVDAVAIDALCEWP